MKNIIELRQKIDNKEKILKEEIIKMLETSDLVQLLTEELPASRLFAIWRVLALAEIPYAIELDYTKKLIEYINTNIATEYGFSYTGKIDNIVPCYNAMLLEAYCKLSLYDSQEVKNAITWIKKYQLFERNQETTWHEDGIKKYGGCLKSIPCYIGIGKVVKSLFWYCNYVDDKESKELAFKGLEYMKKHSFYKRLSNGKEIYNHITDFAFPQSYLLNVVDLAEVTYLGNVKYEEKKDLIDFIKSNQNSNGYWKNNYIYSGKGYISFDGKKKNSEFLAYVLNKYTKYEQK
jgi:hypothetical protein